MSYFHFAVSAVAFAGVGLGASPWFLLVAIGNLVLGVLHACLDAKEDAEESTP